MNARAEALIHWLRTDPGIYHCPDRPVVIFDEFKQWLVTPERVEDSHPTLAEHLRLVANGAHPVVKTVATFVEGIMLKTHKDSRYAGANILHRFADDKTFVAREPRAATPTQGRNDRCACGSGKKYKHCCIP